MSVEIRRAKRKGYSIIDNAIMKDKRVGLAARGLWTTVMSLPPKDIWDFTIKGLVSIVPESRATVYRLIAELVKCGYCIHRQARNTKGRFLSTRYTFIERPCETSGPSVSHQPDTAGETQSITKEINYANIYNHTSSQAEVPVPVPVEPVHEGEDFDVDRFDDWVDSGVELLDPQPYLSPTFAPREARHVGGTLEPIPKAAHSVMYRLCFRADTDAEQMMVSSAQRGKVASILGKLRDSGANFHKMHLFEAWWVQNWRSRDRVTKQYQAPRPEQVLEFWHEAMKADLRPTTIVSEKPKHEITNLTDIMRKHRNE